MKYIDGHIAMLLFSVVCMLHMSAKSELICFDFVSYIVREKKSHCDACRLALLDCVT